MRATRPSADEGLGAAKTHGSWETSRHLLVVAVSYSLRVWVLRSQAVTDDEEVYLFTARTLLHGRVVNPLPDVPAFFENQFVILNSRGWFGKYPIGHSLVLALGLKLSMIDLVIPLLGGLTAHLTWRLGRLWVGPRRALLALGLLAVSPHFVATHATLLSQTTTCFALVAASLAAARAQTFRWARALAGAALALGLLSRPAPMGLLAPLVMIFVFLGDRRLPLKTRLARQVPLVVPVLAAGLALVAVNALQTGSPLDSAYLTVHGGLGFGGSVRGQTGLSVFGGILRENFWLFGWPLSLLPVAFARPRRGALMLWGALLVQVAYRLGVPKTVVSTTGPIYLMETVPFLALLAADGLRRLELLLGRWWGPSLARQRVTSGVLSCVLAALFLFTPVVTSSAASGALARGAVFELLEASGVERAVVFTKALVVPQAYQTWAYYPPNPDPALNEPLLFLRWPRGMTEQQVLAYAQSHFPDRAALAFTPEPEPRLRALKGR